MFDNGLFIASGNRCAVDFAALKLPINDIDALAILQELGYKTMYVDVVGLARNQVGVAQHRRNCRSDQAPAIVDCSSLTQWLYGQVGVLLPRLPIDQRHSGFLQVNAMNELEPGDLVFTTGLKTLYWDDPGSGVGHVGIYTAQETIIHANSPQDGVVEWAFDDDRLHTFRSDFRGAVRIIRHPFRTFTIKSTRKPFVQHSSHFRWKILGALAKRES